MVFSYLGIALCSIVLVQLVMWTASSCTLLIHNRRQFAASQEMFRKQIDQLEKQSAAISAADKTGDWKGYRQFFVERLVRETDVCTSVYIKPVDQKPIATFSPGQHLTFRFQLPGQSKPVVRCYSLSNAPDQECYRISVKTVSAPSGRPELPDGLISSYINRTLIKGDRVEVKSPAGAFHLDEHSDGPVVLMAGGIGVTPMISIIENEIQSQSDRPILLFYGVRNGRDHAFQEYLKKVDAENPNISVINCYSEPDAENDVPNRDYHLSGYVTVDLLKQVLPNNRCQFYLCGPPPFMKSIFDGLAEWQVPESRIHFEAFGPASIKKRKPAVESRNPAATGAVIRFSTSGKELTWSEESESILELAEDHQVLIPSGCRAGSCGTCATVLKSGQVTYPDNVQPECAAGECLVCIARPNGPIELEA